MGCRKGPWIMPTSPAGGVSAGRCPERRPDKSRGTSRARLLPKWENRYQRRLHITGCCISPTDSLAGSDQQHMVPQTLCWSSGRMASEKSLIQLSLNLEIIEIFLNEFDRQDLWGTIKAVTVSGRRIWNTWEDKRLLQAFKTELDVTRTYILVYDLIIKKKKITSRQQEMSRCDLAQGSELMDKLVWPWVPTTEPLLLNTTHTTTVSHFTDGWILSEQKNESQSSQQQKKPTVGFISVLPPHLRLDPSVCAARVRKYIKNKIK